jgi:hypothetical protein
MRIRNISLSLTTGLLFLQIASGQGFVNLNFEQATIAPTPVGGSTFPADPAQCFPGWTVGSGAVVSYNDLSIGAPAVDLMGPSFPNFVGYTPLQGSYSVLLQYFGEPSPPTLSQTGLVPAGTESINFLVATGESDAVVTLNGTPISLIPIAGGRLTGDVSAFAGTVAQLTFSTTSTGYAGNWLYFDDVQFSASPIPEPSVLGLSVLGGLFLARRCLHRPRGDRPRRFLSPVAPFARSQINFRFSFRAPHFNLRAANGLKTVQHAVPLRPGVRAP